MQQDSTGEAHQLHQLALTAGAIGFLVEKYDTLENDSKPLTPHTQNHHSLKSGTVRTSLANNLFDAYISTLDPTFARTVRDNKTPWKTWVSQGHHIRLTRGEPNLNTDRANAFDKGANTLAGDDWGALFTEEILGGAPLDNLTYGDPEDPINTWFKYIPTTSGSISKCIYYSTIQNEDFSFSKTIDLIDIMARVEELEHNRPEWLALLYSEYEQFFQQDEQTTTVFDAPEKVTPTELSASEQAASQDTQDQGKQAG